MKRGRPPIEIPDLNRVIYVLKANYGLLSYASKDLHISVNTLRKWINGSAKLRKALQDIREEVKDMAEKTLFLKLKHGDIKTAIWFLTHIGQDRGYLPDNKDNTKFVIEIKKDKEKLIGEIKPLPGNK